MVIERPHTTSYWMTVMFALSVAILEIFAGKMRMTSTLTMAKVEFKPGPWNVLPADIINFCSLRAFKLSLRKQP